MLAHRLHYNSKQPARVCGQSLSLSFVQIHDRIEHGQQTCHITLTQEPG